MSESSGAPAKKPISWVWPFLGVLALAGLGSVIAGDEESEQSESQSISAEVSPGQDNAVSTEQEETEPPEELEEFEWPPLEPIVLEGSGDDVVVLDSPVSLAAMDVNANDSGRYFGIKPILATGEAGISLVNTTDPFDGTVLLLGTDQDAIAGFEVSSNGPWSFVIKSIAEVPFLGQSETIEGSGDALVRLDETVGLTTITVTGNSEGRYFGVRPHGATYSFSVINTTDPYTGTVRLDPGTLLLEITAIGSWSISLN